MFLRLFGGKRLSAIYPYLTIIVPVYNTAVFLRQCMDSILAQTFTDVEILCIDDGSTDKSPEILDEYASTDSRIRVIHKANGGLVSVRKLGVEEAKGRYIGFVDSDDWIDTIMYERLCSCAKEHDADFVSSSYWQEGVYSNISRDAIEAGIYDESRMGLLRNRAIFYLEKHDKGLSGSLCTKIFRAELLKKVMPNIPDKIKVSEDKVTSITFLLDCNVAVILDEAYYHYRINSNSMFHAEDPDYLLNYHIVYNYFKSLYSHKNFTENMRTQAELYIVQFLIKGINTQLGFSFRNLMWIDPDWIEDNALGKRIALCGKGDLGKTYEEQIKNSKSKEFVGYIDIDNKSEVDTCISLIDSIVITTKNENNALKTRNQLIENGIEDSKIFWFRQEEIFWKYAKAMGLLVEENI